MIRRLILAVALISAAPATAQSVQSSVAPDVWNSLQLCPVDNLFHFKTSVCPAPNWVPSPSLAGAVPIPATGFNLASAVHLTGGTGVIAKSSAPDVVGAFRFICTAGQVLADDPIVFPGQPGKSHLHQFYGNTSADAYSTYASLRNGGVSSCQNSVAIPGNRSAYWMPAMLDGTGQVVKPAFVSIYYKRRPSSDPKCSLTKPGAEGNCVPIPNGIKFIFGYDMLTGKAPTGGLWFNCQGPTAVAGHYPNLTIALANCPASQGNKLGAVIEAPQCWDGKNLDSPNHRDHVAYMVRNTNTGQIACPSTHPNRMPTFTLGAWYPVASGMHLSSDAMVPNAAPGSTFHADYFEAWEPSVKVIWTDNCINKMLNCSGGDLGNGQTLNGAAI